MKDVFDARARILMVKKADKVVGSVRVMFHDKFEDSELYYGGVRELSGIAHEEAVEASRLCTDPAFRGIDIALTLISHMYISAIKSGKRYIYGGASGSMIDFYRRLGWNVLDERFESPFLQRMPHSVVIVDLHEAVLGRNTSMRIWRRVYKSLFEYLYEREIIFPTRLDLLRLRLWSLWPLSN